MNGPRNAQQQHWPSQCHPTPLEGVPPAGIRHSSLDIRHSPACRCAQHTLRARRGFTLVELLIVIVIIAILASLLLVAITAAMRSARVAAIKAEVESLSNAVEEYRSERGDYPPNPTSAFPGPGVGRDRFVRHVRKAFPRYVGGYDQIRDAIEQATKPTPMDPGLDIGDPADPMILDAAEALVFWLGGLPLWRGTSVELTGFSLNPRNPFEHADDPQAQQRSQPLFDFRPERFTDYDNDGWPEYIPPGTAVSGEMPPYVYFDSDSYGPYPYYPYPFASPLARQLARQFGFCIPYVTNTDGNSRVDQRKNQWVNPQKFQIISSGLDGRYGTSDPASANAGLPRRFPDGRGYDTDEKADDDNLTNFATGTLGDEREKARP